MVDYVKTRVKHPTARVIDAHVKEMNLAIKRPWAAKEFPVLASYLQRNEKSLAVILEATKRPDYFNPVVAAPTTMGPGALVNALLPNAQKCRVIGEALAARALLRVGEGHCAEAWQDLLASHRLGRLVGRGGLLIEAAVADDIDWKASLADLAFVDRAALTPQQLLDCRRDLRQLPPLPSLADKFELGDRFVHLEFIMLLHRYGGFEFVTGEKQDVLTRWNMARADWDPALRKLNRMFDRVVAALRIEDRVQRKAQLEQLRQELMELHKQVKNVDLASWLAQQFSGKLVGERVGDVLIGMVFPAFVKPQNGADMVEQMQRNVHVAFALAAYRAEHGRYPPALKVLTPMYLKQVPGDLFSGKELIYRPNEKGYLLYSVGPNGEDEGGQGPDGHAAGDDIAVRMPLPELKQK